MVEEEEEDSAAARLVGGDGGRSANLSWPMTVLWEGGREGGRERGVWVRGRQMGGDV